MVLATARGGEDDDDRGGDGGNRCNAVRKCSGVCAGKGEGYCAEGDCGEGAGAGDKCDGKCHGVCSPKRCV
eukprot:8131047-Alexandrium_andersonii.AAC.1